jgi:ATP-binding cassette, subfamily B, bacterial CvaB/MchF/RaxB
VEPARPDLSKGKEAMNDLSQALDLRWRRRLPLVRQTETAECGVACLAMVAAWHGLRTDLSALRTRLGVTPRGMSLARLAQCAEALGLSCRPLRIEMEDLPKLAVPAILHWDLDHFVVLRRVRGRRVEVHDPARGVRRLSLEEVGRHFTGVALELTPSQGFRPADVRARLKLRDLVGRTRGLGPALARDFVVAGTLHVLAMALPFLSQLVIDEVLVTRDDTLLVLVAAAIGLVALSQSCVGLARDWAVMALGSSFGLQWTANVFHHLVRLPVSWFERRMVGDVEARFASVQEIQRGLTIDLLESLLDGLVALGTLAVMLLYSAKLSALALGAALLYALVRWLRAGSVRRMAEEAWSAHTRLGSHFLETVRGIGTLRVNGAVARRETAWRNFAVDARNADIRQGALDVAFHAVTTLVGTLLLAAVLWVGARLVLGGEFSVGMLVAFLSLQATFTTASGNLLEKVSRFTMLRVYAERLADIVLTPPESADRGEPDGVERGAEAPALDLGAPSGGREREGPAIEVRGVRFSYGAGLPEVLRGVDMELRRGEVLALVGESGGGKTTLVKLILGLYPLPAGSIHVLGTDTAGPAFDALRPRIGTVLQDDCVFSGSVLENITLFAPDPDPERAARCAQAADLHQDIGRWPMRYETHVGESGATLSGGQRQRLLLARALYKDPGLLILDEATSHLDVKRELRVVAGLRESGLPILLVAHRPETIAFADRVVELANGRLSEVPLGARAGSGVPCPQGAMP